MKKEKERRKLKKNLIVFVRMWHAYMIKDVVNHQKWRTNANGGYLSFFVLNRKG